MPKLNPQVPSGILDHLAERLHERRISVPDLQALSVWIKSNPTVPEGNWYKDFGTFTLAGTAEFVKTFLTEDMAPYGEEVF